MKSVILYSTTFPKVGTLPYNQDVQFRHSDKILDKQKTSLQYQTGLFVPRNHIKQPDREKKLDTLHCTQADKFSRNLGRRFRYLRYGKVKIRSKVRLDLK